MSDRINQADIQTIVCEFQVQVVLERSLKIFTF